MSLLEEFKRDISDDVIEFVNSAQFTKFEKIMNQLYQSKLVDFHTKTTSTFEELISDKKVLNVYLNLPELFKQMEKEVIYARQEVLEKTEE